jgi:phosphomannomutase
MDAITFGTDGWRTHRDEFTAERVRAVSQAIVDHLDAEGLSGRPVAVGYDARAGARDRAEECCRVLAGGGHDVLLGQRDYPTPVIAHGILDRDLAGGVVFTASHNPAAYLGVKFLPADGAPALPAVTNSLEDRLREPALLSPSNHGSVTEVDFAAAHAEHCLDLVEPALDGLTVAYDAMYASGRGITDELLERAGADVHRLRCETAPDFGGTPPDPSAEHLSELLELVSEGEVDLGLANDGDADRIAVATPNGLLDPNHLFGLLYEEQLQANTGPAVRSISTSSLVDLIAAAHGETVHETPVGFKWVAKAMAEHDALIGGEESGGFSIRGHVREKDGVLVALLVTSMAAKRPLEERLDDLLATYGERHQDRYSVDCPDERKQSVMETLSGTPPERIADTTVESITDIDGVKFGLADGTWLLVRPSGTEPKLRVYAEAATSDRVEELLEAGRSLLDDTI